MRKDQLSLQSSQSQLQSLSAIYLQYVLFPLIAALRVPEEDQFLALDVVLLICLNSNYPVQETAVLVASPLQYGSPRNNGPILQNYKVQLKRLEGGGSSIICWSIPVYCNCCTFIFCIFLFLTFCVMCGEILKHVFSCMICSSELLQTSDIKCM